MIAGKLRQRVTIQERVLNQDAYGHPAPTWSTLYDTWAELVNVSGRENWANESVLNSTDQVFKIRWRSGIEPEMSVYYNGIRYQIAGYPIDPTGRKRELLLTCKRIDS
jgi:SPP1 family predicted phage head-tail adaptor